MSLLAVQRMLRDASDPIKAAFFPRFFKSGPGEYGEGDQFIGITVPEQRKIAKEFYQKLTISDTVVLLHSTWHEERLTALFILVLKYQKGDAAIKQKVVNTYLANTNWVNNWDLVDSSAPYIVGDWLEDNPYKMKVLTKLAKSDSLWERRIAMLSCYDFIRKGSSKEAFQIIEILKDDTHDLIQKAAGWMLREIGKRVNVKELTDYLDRNAAILSRTTLRYAIERLPEVERKYYLVLK